MIIPYDQLSQEALLGVLDEFILREGTDYGLQEVPHHKKQERLLLQLKEGNVVVVFEPEDQTITLKDKKEVQGENKNA
jgi:hypothetical protein